MVFCISNTKKGTREMNNEPVAWIDPFDLERVPLYDCWVSGEKTKSVDIPLYTHPVKELDEQFKKGFEAGKEEGWKAHKFHHPVKELTDEEIMELWYPLDLHDEAWVEDSVLVNFARAILRKAQEK
jgi:hypothetical protein